LVSTAAQRVENRQLAERAKRSSASDCFLEGSEKMDVASEESAGDGGVVMVSKRDEEDGVKVVRSGAIQEPKYAHRWVK